MPDHYALYRTMLLIRRFEERALAEFSTGKLFGTTHAYIGQEADATGIFDVTKAGHVVFSSHRCHGHFLAYGGDPYSLAAELMGRATGLVGGRGGSQHIQWRNFYSNGIQGGIVPLATGAALAEKTKKTGNVSLVFIGDGTLGEGVLYESLNIASLWQIPVLFVVENNHYAQTTPIALGVAGSIAARFAAFNIQSWERATTDVLEIRSAAEEALDYVRHETRPAALILQTYRFSAHSKGDDIRDRAEIEQAKKHDPLLTSTLNLTQSQRAAAEAEVQALVDDAFTRATNDPFPTMESSEQ